MKRVISQTLHMHAELSRGGRGIDLVRSIIYVTCTSSEASGETSWMGRLIGAIAVRICDKYQNLMN